MNHTFYEVAVIFFAYSFLAWIAETAVATFRMKDFRNRGFASGPFCFVYGFTGVILTVFLMRCFSFWAAWWWRLLWSGLPVRCWNR